MASVELEAVSKSFGRQRAVRDVTLAIEDREFVVFVGPSGCGKSTLLRMIAGLEEIDAGEIRIAGKRVNDVPAADRGVAMVFQSYALYPHMNVAENMGFGLRMSGAPKAEVARKVAEAAAILQIEDLLARRPRALSGGQRQRVAIGRAIVREPDVFLFDEPLSNLDAGLRVQMRVEIARLHRELATTMVYVTHDQVEAMTLADRIVVLNDGRIEQQGAPLDLYERPANHFVAGFLGQPQMNFIPVQADGDSLRMPEGTRIPAPPTTTRTPGRLVLGVRPDALALAAPGTEGALPGTVEFVEHLGSQTLVHVRLPGGGLVTVECQGKHRPPAGEPVGLRYDPREAHLFAEDGGRLE